MRLSALSLATGRATDKMSVVHGENGCRPESAGRSFAASCLYDGHLVRRDPVESVGGRRSTIGCVTVSGLPTPSESTAAATDKMSVVQGRPGHERAVRPVAASSPGATEFVPYGRYVVANTRWIFEFGGVFFARFGVLIG